MKRILSIILIVLGAVMLFYGSVKLAQSDEQEAVTVERDGFTVEMPKEAEDRGETAVNIGGVLTLAGLILFFVGKKKSTPDF